MTGLHRRELLITSLGLLTFAGAVKARSNDVVKSAQAELRGAIDVTQYGIIPETVDDQSKSLMKLINKSADTNLPLFIPPGNYRISNLDLPDRTRIIGVAGATRLIYGGEGHMLMSARAKRIELSNLVLDGANRWLADYANGLLHFSDATDLHMENCEIGGSAKSGLWLEKCGGTIRNNAITGASLSAIYAVESQNLDVASNRIADCGNGGILIHRWKKGFDGTRIRDNQITGIAAQLGGTGENGNGVNVFRADNVQISGNSIADCAFSAIRSNAGSNVQIITNQCTSSGETAIYAEFGFEGSIIANNIIDGAANGISVVNFNEGGRLATVTGNIIRHLKREGPYTNDGIGFGIGISAEADTVISGNVVEEAAKWGMAIGWGPYLRNVLVNGNIIRATPVGIAVSTVDGVGLAMLTNNQFQATPNGSILGYHWNDIATGDLSRSAAPLATNLQVSNNQQQ